MAPQRVRLLKEGDPESQAVLTGLVNGHVDVKSVLTDFQADLVKVQVPGESSFVTLVADPQTGLSVEEFAAGGIYIVRVTPQAAGPDHALLEEALRIVSEQQTTLEEIKKANEDRHHTLYQDLLQLKQMMGGTLARSAVNSSEEAQRGSSHGSHPGSASPMLEDPHPNA